MPTTCSFQLDRMDAVYNSGEYIHGRIVLKTEKMKRVNGKLRTCANFILSNFLLLNTKQKESKQLLEIIMKC